MKGVFAESHQVMKCLDKEKPLFSPPEVSLDLEEVAAARTAVEFSSCLIMGRGTEKRAPRRLPTLSRMSKGVEEDG
jgi:hypothetical protein